MTDIKTLNDNFRKSFSGGKVLLTCGISAKSAEERHDIILKVRIFNTFNEKNDPHHEHDYGSFSYKGETICWKIDYYDKMYQYGSEDPADESKTNRVLTIMLSSEY